MEAFKKELDFGLDNFQQQKYFDSKNSVANVIMNLLLMKPGGLPSLPHIGINIRQYLYALEGDLDPDFLKEQIYNQCSDLIPYISLGDVKVFVANYRGQSVLIINIPLQDTTLPNSVPDSLIVGVTKNNLGDVTFNYQYESNLNNL